jgi:hypothetical protein
MRKSFLILFSMFLVTFFFPRDANAGDSRRWSDSSGKYTVEAELITVDKNLVVLERQDGELIALRRDELSDSDQKFLQKLDSAQEVSSERTVDSIWELGNGDEIAGSLIGFGRQELIVKREGGKIWVNERRLEELPAAYRKILPNVVAAIDSKPITSVGELEEHLAEFGAGPFRYTVSGVQLDLKDWGTITIPLSLLTIDQAKEIQPLLDRWQAAQQEDVSDVDRQDTESFERLALESRQRHRERYLQRYQTAVQTRQFRLLELGLLAVNAGVTDVWAVAVYPINRYGYGRTVLVTAPNSLVARRRVALKYPYWEIGAIVKRSY